METKPLFITHLQMETLEATLRHLSVFAEPASRHSSPRICLPELHISLNRSATIYHKNIFPRAPLHRTSKQARDSRPARSGHPPVIEVRGQAAGCRFNSSRDGGSPGWTLVLIVAAMRSGALGQGLDRRTRQSTLGARPRWQHVLRLKLGPGKIGDKQDDTQVRDTGKGCGKWLPIRSYRTNQDNPS